MKKGGWYLWLSICLFAVVGCTNQSDQGDLLCGFNSWASLNWFKFKTLISDRIAVAKYRARNLNDRFGPS
jgi:hypothetical protein